MKNTEKAQAIKLRKQGVSMGEIANKLNVAKSSVSYWVRDVVLTPAQRKRLNSNGHSVDAIEKRRLARLSNTSLRRRKIMNAAIEEAEQLKDSPLWCVGVALYWGEGGKTQQSIRLSNSDPAVIKTMVRFFQEICKIPKDKFHGHVHTFSHVNARKAEEYWSQVSGIPINNFYKTYSKPSSASKQKRQTIPNGTFQFYIHDTNLFYRMMGWIDYLKKKDLC